MAPFFHQTSAVLDVDGIMPALQPIEVKLINRVEVFRGIFVELFRKRPKEFFDCFGLHEVGTAIDRDNVGGHADVAPNDILVSQRCSRGASSSLKKVFRERFHCRRVVAFATENIEVGIVGIVRKMPTDQ